MALQPGEAIIFEHVDYQGKSLKLNADTPNFVVLNFNDILSSIKVGPATTVTLYRDVNYGGNTVVVDKDVPNIGAAFNDQASSLKIAVTLKQGEAIIYEHVNYGGKALFLNADTPNFVVLNFNDILSSIKVGPNTTVTLYRDVNYGGNTVVVDKDIPNVGAAFNDQASSLKIAFAPPPPALQPGEAIIYRDANYQGTSLKLTADAPNFVTLNFNDILSSIKVGPNTVVTLYRDVDYGGNTVKVDKDVPYIGDSFNDQASSLKISLAPRTAIIYQDANYGGRSLVLTQDTPNFIPLNFNDILSSLKVGSEVTLFRDVDYQGPSVKITQNTPWIGDVFNDQASSLKFT